MSESKNCNHLVLSKDDQDLCYRIVQMMRDIETDLGNADLQMHEGRFFDAMDNVRISKQKSQIAQHDLAIFVNSLRDKKLWI